MPAYYNEFDPKAAAWLRELIKAGAIAPGEVDERSITEVRPDDLRGFEQCHFFAGIGGWSEALRLAGWPDDRPVWTGSCPCQPFSAAGKGKAADDERHLWPAWVSLIRECRPAVVFGEQVEAAIGWGWLDAVFADLEGEGYACGAADLCAAGIGAPHIRQRVYFVAHAESVGREGHHLPVRPARQDEASTLERGSLARVAEPMHPERRAINVHRENGRDWQNERRAQAHGQPGACGEVFDMGDAERSSLEGHGRHVEQHGSPRWAGEKRHDPTAGFWSSAEWIACRDGKARPIESRSFPLAHGVPARVVRLRGYGNAIVPQVAAAFIEAAADVICSTQTVRVPQ